MKHIATILTAIVLMSNTGIALANPGSSSFHQQGSIHWETNYQTALAQAREAHKPIMLFFTGSGWCSWCQKLDEEALNRREFAQAIGDRMIFVKLDYPSSPSAVSPQMKQLRSQYAISSYPTVIIIDDQERILGKTGYKAGGPQSYAAHLGAFIKNYQTVPSAPAAVSKEPAFEGNVLSHDAIRKAYEEAMAAGNEEEAAALLKKGLNIDRNHYFLNEQQRRAE